jgi:tetratricopeptide (TPR) repeat protein
MENGTEALLELAEALRRAGRVGQAIAAYSQLLEREPELPDSWYNLAWLQRQARQYEAALESYAQALDRGVAEPEEVHLNRAVILSDHLSRPGEAEAELKAALTLHPDYLPALLNLGNLYEDQGNRDSAEAAYRRAVEVAPGDALALSRLAGVVDASSEDGTELIDRVRERLLAAHSSAERADLGFALGRLLDARGEYDSAFSAYSDANKASHESLGPQFQGYDRARHERLVDRLIGAFPEPLSKGGEGVEAPVFICGMFRSGSTLVEQIIGAHSRVKTGGELDLIPALVQHIRGYPEAVAAANHTTIDSWRSFYLAGSAHFAQPGYLLTDKRPDNFLHIGLIKTLFPDAKIVHTRRNRLDNLLSLYFLHLNPQMTYALDLGSAAHWYRQYERLMAHWKRLYPEGVHDVDYDQLVREPRPVIERLLEFVGVSWEDSALDFNRRSAPVKTASVWQVREPLNARSSGRWRNYADRLEQELGELPSA